MALFAMAYHEMESPIATRVGFHDLPVITPDWRFIFKHQARSTGSLYASR